jgi:hypothetical protein
VIGARIRAVLNREGEEPANQEIAKVTPIIHKNF